MFANSICIPPAGVVPRSSGAPNWLTGTLPTDKHLDDPNWGGALLLSYGQAGIPNQQLSGEQATFRALFAGTDLFLSWLVRVDPDNNADLGFDALHLGFSIGLVGSPQQRAALLRVQISQNETNPVIDDNQFIIDTYLWDPVNKWGTPVKAIASNLQYDWMLDGTHNIRVWTGQPFDNTPNLPVALQSINTVAWAVQMRIPIGTIVPANLNNSGNAAFTIGNSFNMWYSMVVKTPSNLQNKLLVEYTWPEPATPNTPDMDDYFVKINPTTLTENVFPDPSSATAPWGTVTVGANAACSGGIAITSDNIGTENTPSSYINPTLVPPNNTPFVNTLYAEPLNRTGGSINAQDITARFRLANWGSQIQPPSSQPNLNTNWTDIRGGEAVQGNNIPIPNNNPGGPATGHYISFTWALNDAERAFYTDTAHPERTHQCMLVELSSPTQHYTFTNNSIVKNMDFFNPPLPFRRPAQIGIHGLIPIAPLGRDVYLHLQLANLPRLIGVGRLPIVFAPAGSPAGHLAVQETPIVDAPDQQQLEIASSAGPFDRTFPFPPIYIVRAFHNTGAEVLVNGEIYTILNAQTPFGYILLPDEEEGPVYGWDHRLEGAEVVGNNFYKVSVPNDGSVEVVTTIDVLSQPRGAKDSGFMVQSNIGTKGDFEVVFPHETAGLVYCSRNNDTLGFPWGNSTVFAQALGFVDAVSLIQSNFGNPGDPGNLEIVARVKDKLFYLKGSGFDLTWSSPIIIVEGVIGNPALIQGAFGTHGNFELVVPLAGGGISHYRRNNDDPAFPWIHTGVFAEQLGQVDAVALIQSNFDQTLGGNLEVIARIGADLYHFWRDSATQSIWSANGKFFSGVAGIPGFIQSNFGSKGNFEVVTPVVQGGMAHLQRNNDDATFPWTEVTTFGSGQVTAVSLLQSNFTTSTNPNIPGPGDFEVAARVDGRTALYWRRDLAPLDWIGPQAYACS